MKKTRLALLSLVSLALLSACQNKPVQPTSHVSVQTSQTDSNSALKAEKKTISQSDSFATEQKDLSEKNKARSRSTAQTLPEKTEAPVATTTDQTTANPSSETQKVGTRTEETILPLDISQINSGVDADAPDFVIGRREDTVAANPDQTLPGKEADAQPSFIDYWAPDSPLTKEVIAVPKHFIGTWHYYGEHQQSTVTIAPDGLVTTEIQYVNHDGSHHREAGYLTGMIKESDQLYRNIGGEGYPMTPITGLGGLGKVATGLYFLSDSEAYFQIWWIPSYDDLEAYDYAANIDYQLPLTKLGQ